jgi:hypothetical protein
VGEISNGNVKTRKSHKCDLCGRTIAIGTTARRLVSTDMGKVYSFYYHPECDRVTILDKWDEIDWECCGGNHSEFIERLEELRAEGKL